MIRLQKVLPAIILLLAASCLDPYNPPVSSAETNYLVIDGFLTDTTGVTSIRLTRTTFLKTESIPAEETGAKVSIEGSDGTIYSLSEEPGGEYTADSLTIDHQQQYRLNITTADSKSYTSDFVDFKKSPPIDSVTFGMDGKIVDILVTTHDNNKKSRYYIWTYEATWAFRSAYNSIVKYQSGKIVNRDVLDDIYHCWRTSHSTDIRISSTKQLSEDIVSKYSILEEPLNSQKFQFECSFLVRQRVLTQNAYEYWNELKKNTENLGTIFGTLPSQNITNIRSTTNPSEPVIGYFTAGSMTEKRMFLNAKQLPPSPHETGYEGCTQDTLKLDHLGTYTGSPFLISPVFKGPGLYGYLLSSQDCVDCREHDGTNIKPAYWDN